MRNVNWRKDFQLVIFSTLLLLPSVSAVADEFGRQGHFEIYTAVQSMNGDTTSTSDFGFRTEIDDDIFYGFGAGVNLTDYFNLNTELLFGSVDVEGTIIDGLATFSVDTDSFLWNLNLDYNILNRRLTPVVSAGVGIFDIDTFSFEQDEEETETDFTYNLAAGVRWDAASGLFVKVLYRWTWIDLDGADDDMQFEGLSVFVGAQF